MTTNDEVLAALKRVIEQHNEITKQHTEIIEQQAEIMEKLANLSLPDPWGTGD